jgi:hypothetical protein
VAAEGSAAEFSERLRASIQERVDRELRAAFRGADDTDDAAVDELAGRGAGLGDLIAARVEEALRKRR